jgi:polyphosphate kinase
MKKNHVFVNRELSWLSFNERVLQEAEDENVPLIERIKFLGIFSNNRDEFFRVRVAALKRMVKFPKKAGELIGEDPVALLDKIQKKVIEEQTRFDRLFEIITKKLAKEHIYIINEKQLTKEQGVFVKEIFREKVLTSLVPIMLDSTPKFPYLKDKSVYLIVKLTRVGRKNKYALLEIPTTDISRFLVIDRNNSKQYIILLDDVIRYCLDDIFAVLEYNAIESHTIKLTRDAELDIDNDISKSFVEKISGSVKKRNRGQPVRLVYDNEISRDTLQYVTRALKFRKADNLIPGGRYHNFKDFINFPDLGKKHLLYEQTPPLPHPEFNIQQSVFKLIKNKDVILAFPYQSYHHIIDFLREASIDPKVESIMITLYRVAKGSNVVNTLINAVKNGKRVTVVVELQARFDEENNIYWANKLTEEGAKVIYGVPGLKVHSKVFLIGRKENGKLVNYAHIGTGNYNEQTAKIYSDISLLTCDERITKETEKLFQFYSDNYKVGTYTHLVVSPFSMRKSFLQLIDKEIANASKKLPAFIILKMNNLVDNEMISKLYEASQKNVKIKLIVRGMCSIVAGVKGLSENIELISIIDKFLEHARIFVFCNGGDEKYFISSADWMTRNLDHRSEVAVPVFDKKIKNELKRILDLQLKDNCKARTFNQKQENTYKPKTGKTEIRSQEKIYNYLKQLRGGN